MLVIQKGQSGKDSGLLTSWAREDKLLATSFIHTLVDIIITNVSSLHFIKYLVLTGNRADILVTVPSYSYILLSSLKTPGLRWCIYIY